MQAAMIPSSTADATTHCAVSGIAWPPLGAAARKKPPRPTTTVNAPSHSCKVRRKRNQPPEDEQQEQELGGQHGLDDTELAEPEGGGLQPEDDQHQPEPDEPDAPPDGMGHQAEAKGGRLGCRLDPDPLEHRGQGIDEGGSRCQQVGHPSVVVAITARARQCPRWRPGRPGRYGSRVIKGTGAGAVVSRRQQHDSARRPQRRPRGLGGDELTGPSALAAHLRPTGLRRPRACAARGHSPRGRSQPRRGGDSAARVRGTGPSGSVRRDGPARGR